MKKKKQCKQKKGEFCLVLGSVYIGKEECLFACISNRQNRKGCDPFDRLVINMHLLRIKMVAFIQLTDIPFEF